MTAYTARPRPVIVSYINGDAVRLAVAPNGGDLTTHGIVALCTAAAIEPRVTPRGVWIRRPELPDLAAICQVKGVTLNTGRTHL